jgi:valyl-tRNA synthetase
MIENKVQYRVTKEQIRKFEISLKFEEDKLVLQQAVVAGIKSQLRDLYEEVSIYERENLRDNQEG